MRLLLVSTLLVPTLSLAQYEFDRSPIDSCWVDVGKYCLDPSVQPKDVFVTNGAKKIEEINQIFHERLEPLWLDNGAHAETLVQEASKIYRTYNYCLTAVCDQILADCSGSSRNDNGLRNATLCNRHRNNLLQLAQAQVKSSIVGNIERKHRSLWAEKLNAISLRFDQYLHPRIALVNTQLAKAANAILSLVPETRSR